jgi:hypothetical protein
MSFGPLSRKQKSPTWFRPAGGNQVDVHIPIAW